MQNSLCLYGWEPPGCVGGSTQVQGQKACTWEGDNNNKGNNEEVADY